MKWFDIIKNVNEQELLQTLRGSNEQQKPPKPDMNAPSVPPAPDLEMEQIRAKLKEAQQSNNPRNIKIYTNKLNALMDKKLSSTAPPIPKPQPLPPMAGQRPQSIGDNKRSKWKNILKPNPQALQEARDTAAKPNQPQSNQPQPKGPPAGMTPAKMKEIEERQRRRRRSIYG